MKRLYTWVTLILTPTILNIGCSQQEAVFQVSSNEKEVIRLIQLPSSDRYPGDMSYFKTSLKSKVANELAKALPTNEVLAQRQRLDYYLNYEFREDINLVVDSDTLSPVLFFHEDMIVDSDSKQFFFAFDVPKSQNKKVLIDAPILSEQYAFEF